MARRRDPEYFRNLQSDVGAFLQLLSHPTLLEDGAELFDLASAEWRLRLEFDKLLLEVWNSNRSLVRRVEELAYRDRGRLGLYVRRPHSKETSVLEFRELRLAERRGREGARSAFRREFVAMLGRESPVRKLEYVSHRSDREHSFSTWYTRGQSRRGTTAWAFIGLGKDEPPAAADAALAFGLIWLEWLRNRAAKTVVPKLQVYLPPAAVDLNVQRARSLNRRAVQLELYEWSQGEPQARLLDLDASGQLQARLVPRKSRESLVRRQHEMLRGLLGDAVDRLTISADAAGDFVSVRVEGLEVARVEGDLSARIYFGLEGSVRRADEAGPEEFQEFILQALARRNAHSRDAADEFYRLQSESWLESMLVRDITKIDPALCQDFVYPQVPAFSRADRGVIDILSVTRAGRLAVIELKLEEEINLPFQALDYWLRVESLRRQGTFRDFGYFPGVSLADAPPLLYLVAPAFRFHSTTARLLRYLDPSIAVIQVGINDQWRRGIKVLFRREKGMAGDSPSPRRL